MRPQKGLGGKAPVPTEGIRGKSPDPTKGINKGSKIRGALRKAGR